jgi:hypothetical protein
MRRAEHLRAYLQGLLVMLLCRAIISVTYLQFRRERQDGCVFRRVWYAESFPDAE